MKLSKELQGLRADLQAGEQTGNGPDGMELNQFLQYHLSEYLLGLGLSARELAALSKEVVASLAADFGRNDLLGELDSDKEIDGYLEQCREVMEKFGINPTDERMRKLVITDYFIFNLTVVISKLFEKSEKPATGETHQKVRYAAGEKKRVMWVPQMAIDKGIVATEGLESISIEGWPFDFVFEKGKEEMANEVLGWLVMDLDRIIRFADLRFDTQRWVGELATLRAIYLCDRLTTSYAFGLKDAETKGVIFLGVKGMTDEKSYSMATTMVHELDHLGDFRKLRALGLTSRSTILFELAAETAALDFARNCSGPRTISWLAESRQKYFDVANGDLSGFYNIKEWDVVNEYLRGCNNPQMWGRVLDVIGRVMDNRAQ